MSGIPGIFESLIPLVAIVTVFTFVGVMSWLKHRRTERDTYYRHELIKQMAEKASSEEQLLAFMREEAKVRQTNKKQGLMVGGLVTLAIGIGYMIAFQWIDDEVWMIGAIPALIGVALLVGSFFVSSTVEESS